MKLASWFWWIGNVVWWVGLPLIFAVYLSRQVQWDYEMGYRMSTDGDSIAIPVVGVFFANTILLAVLNATAWVVRKLRSQKKTPNPALQGMRDEAVRP